MDAATITSWMGEIERTVRSERDYLVQLDAAIGDAAPGDKTMVDALEPAVETLRAEVAAGAPLSAALTEAATAAEAGMRATVPLQARKGRASYLGERSIGHQDPGATSTALILRALQRAVAAAG